MWKYYELLSPFLNHLDLDFCFSNESLYIAFFQDSSWKPLQVFLSSSNNPLFFLRIIQLYLNSSNVIVDISKVNLVPLFEASF